jgi:hypothetical protein
MKACNSGVITTLSETLFGHQPFQLAVFVTRHQYLGEHRVAELTKFKTHSLINHPQMHNDFRVSIDQGISLIGCG